MNAALIDGASIARALREAMKGRSAALAGRGIRAGLGVIQVGDDPASRVYVRNKIRACAEIGMRSEHVSLPGEAPESLLLDHVRALNRDAGIHGILVQLPLPPGISTDRVIEAIAPEKDVDGFHPVNAGLLLAGRQGFVPCTPLGVLRLLDHECVPIEGRHAVVIGRSNIVGKPMALLLLQRDATVTICNSRTPDLGAVTRQADILVAAAGRPGLVTAGMVKSGAVVVDVGINRLADGRLAGDVDFPGVLRVASRITPVPGGVGPMTIAMLLENTLAAAERAAPARRMDGT